MLSTYVTVFESWERLMSVFLQEGGGRNGHRVQARQAANQNRGNLCDALGSHHHPLHVLGVCG